MCQAGGKLFTNWFNLNSTKKLINELESDIEFSISQLLDMKKEENYNQDTWIHPDLAIQLAQWISPKFALQISKWNRNLFINENIELNAQLIDKNKRIKILENKILKKQQRYKFKTENVIYILQANEHKHKRIYVIGKTNNLKNRLSVYNKSFEHIVIYQKSCKDQETMNIIELLVLNKLNEYREKINRDRFILPFDKDISFFINIINECIEFMI